MGTARDHDDQDPQRPADVARCPVHQLVLTPDGLCTRCKRRQQRRISKVVWGAVGVIVVVGAMASTVVWIGSTRPPSAPEQATSVGPGPGAESGEAPEPAATAEQPSTLTEPVSVEQPTAPLDREFRNIELAREAQNARDGAERKKQRQERIEAAMMTISPKLYVTDWCPACQKALVWFAQNRIPHTVQNVERDPAAKREKDRLNPKGSIPTIDVNGRVIVGFRPAEIQRAIRAAAEAKVDAVPW